MKYRNIVLDQESLNLEYRDLGAGPQKCDFQVSRKSQKLVFVLFLLQALSRYQPFRLTFFPVGR